MCSTFCVDTLESLLVGLASIDMLKLKFRRCAVLPASGTLQSVLDPQGAIASNYCLRNHTLSSVHEDVITRHGMYGI